MKIRAFVTSGILALFISVFGVVANARVDAIYTVPTVSPNLAHAATFPTRSDQNIYGSPEKLGLLRFTLPEELTGLSHQFELSRKADGKWDGSGSDGSRITGTCARQNSKWFSCTIAFEGLVIDVPARDLILSQRFGRGFEFGQRSAVARFFEGQPLGIVKVRIGRG